MKYKSLKKIYYSDNQLYEQEYTSRFNNQFTTHLGLTIKEFNYDEEFQLFFCQTEEMSKLQNNILSSTVNLFKCLQEMPGAGIRQFVESCLIAEIKSSNDIEGVRSSRKEIKEAFNQKTTPSSYVRQWGIVNKYRKIIDSITIPLNTCEDIRKLYDFQNRT